MTAASTDAEPRYVVPASTSYHVLTVLLAAAALGAAALGFDEGGWLRWFLVVTCIVVAVIVVNRARARVVVTTDGIDIGHELGTTRLARRDLEDLQLARDGLGWAPRLVMRDGSHHRVEGLAAFRRGEAALALGELRFALEQVPATRGPDEGPSSLRSTLD